MDRQSVKTTERGGVRGFGHKLVKGRKRHILVDTLGFPIACRVMFLAAVILARHVF